MIGYTDIVAKGINVGWAFMSTRFFRQPERKCVGNKCPPYACYNRLPAGAPFGGYKTSGIGRETHKMMLAAYTQVKNIYISTREEREGMY